MELFRWIRERPGVYDLASSGVLKIEVGNADPKRQLEDVVSSTYGVSPNDVVLTSGAQEGSFLAYIAVKPSLVFTVAPEYEPIYRLPEAFGTTSVTVRSPLKAELREGSLLVFSNPNNPTGRFLHWKRLWELSDEARRKKAYVIVDIIFSDFVTDDYGDMPLEHVIYSGSTDKFYTSDLRVGWAFGDREVIKRIRFLKDLANPGPREVEKKVGAFLLENRAAIKRRNLEIIERNFETLASALRPLHYTPHMPIALVATNCDDVSLAERLLKSGVKTVPGSFFKAPGTVRIGLGSETPERFAAAVEVMKKWWC